ncbi:MAG: hypothetical protein Q4F13_03425 [Pseudomonadota bacterium]|nr:hypothetical protein [Pseudomonadota bacterium]
MSVMAFIESQSADPVERAIAARVVDILHNPHLTHVQRRALVLQAQDELIAHQRQRAVPPMPARPTRKRQRGAALDPIAVRRREMGR